MSEEDRLAAFVMSSTRRAARGLDFLRRLQDAQHVLSDQDAFDSNFKSSDAETENHKHAGNKSLVYDSLAQEEEAAVRRGKVDAGQQQEEVEKKKVATACERQYQLMLSRHIQLQQELKRAQQECADTTEKEKSRSSEVEELDKRCVEMQEELQRLRTNELLFRRETAAREVELQHRCLELTHRSSALKMQVDLLTGKHRLLLLEHLLANMRLAANALALKQKHLLQFRCATLMSAREREGKIESSPFQYSFSRNCQKSYYVLDADDLSPVLSRLCPCLLLGLRQKNDQERRLFRAQYSAGNR
jgi:hypothetical protein